MAYEIVSLRGVFLIASYLYHYYDHNRIITTEVGATLIPARHQVDQVVAGEPGGIVVSQLKRGVIDKEGLVLRYV
jgi:hypothetical protein